MAKISLLLFALVVTAGKINGAAVRSDRQPALKFIGEFSKPMGRLDTTVEGHAGSKQTSYYFLSQNSAGFANAEADCKAQLSPDATLLYIETEEELEAVNSFLSGSDDTGSTYWVGGRYDPDSRKLVWGNGVEIGAFVPWDNGHPNSQAPVTRVSAYTVGSLKLRTQFQTVSNRYICELQIGARHTGDAEFRFLGQYKSPDTRIGISGVSKRQASFYFLSVNIAPSYEAENECKWFLGDDAHLLRIETQEELQNVTEFLSGWGDTNGTVFWTSGRYNPQKQTFVWGNDTEFGPWAPWDVGMPNSRTPVTCVYARYVDSLSLGTAYSIVSYRYICELE